MLLVHRGEDIVGFIGYSLLLDFVIILIYMQLILGQ